MASTSRRSHNAALYKNFQDCTMHYSTTLKYHLTSPYHTVPYSTYYCTLLLHNHHVRYNTLQCLDSTSQHPTRPYANVWYLTVPYHTLPDNTLLYPTLPYRTY